VWRAPAPTTPGTLSPPAARRLLRTHTQPGDIVIDIDNDQDFAVAAAQTGRHHHALGREHPTAALGHATGYIDLILLHWPRPDAHPPTLLAACRELLRGAGVLVIVVALDPPRRSAHLSALTGAAHSAGLRDVRHVAILPAGEATPTPHTDLLIFLPGESHDD
jgi:hypothetical protein